MTAHLISVKVQKLHIHYQLHFFQVFICLVFLVFLNISQWIIIVLQTSHPSAALGCLVITYLLMKRRSTRSRGDAPGFHQLPRSLMMTRPSEDYRSPHLSLDLPVSPLITLRIKYLWGWWLTRQAISGSPWAQGNSILAGVFFFFLSLSLI